MPLDWLNTPLDADIGDLIARKKRAKTIELLRSQLQGRIVPPVQLRLPLVDLLVQAGPPPEPEPPAAALPDPAVLVEPPPIPATRTATPPAAETDTTRRVRGVFRKFLASLPGTGSGPEPAATLPPAPVPFTPPQPSA